MLDDFLIPNLDENEIDLADNPKAVNDETVLAKLISIVDVVDGIEERILRDRLDWPQKSRENLFS